jgi:hypothetical protein
VRPAGRVAELGSLDSSMNGHNNAARILVALGAVVLIAAALLHLSAYPKDLGAVSASNLGARLKGGVRALFFLVGWEWIVIAIIMLISAFNVTLFKVIVFFCGGSFDDPLRWPVVSQYRRLVLASSDRSCVSICASRSFG